MARPHVFPVSIYYEDTDFSGLVYHANYLKYCERAREHVLGRDALVALYRDQGIGFVVYRAELQFKEGARFGDELEVRTTVDLQSEYRAVFQQPIFRVGSDSPLVEVAIHLVAVDRNNKLTRLPRDVIEMARARS